jgi:glycosyltransferase involved in cell wall biosynthesis
VFSDIFNLVKYLPLFCQEYRCIRQYKIKRTLKVLRIAVGSVLRAIYFKRTLCKNLQKKYYNQSCEWYFYSYWLNEFTLGAVLLKKKIPETKVFSRAHRWDVYFERNHPPYLPFREYIFRNINKVFTVSENGRDYLNAKIHASLSDKISVSKLGVFVPDSARSKYSSSPVLKVVSISFFHPEKRIHLLIDAISTLGINACWTHIGGSPGFEEVRQYASARLSKSNLSFNLPGTLTKKEVYAYLSENDFDVLLNTSISEGIPVSMMEAMSFGIPCIGTNVGGVSEIITDGQNGFLLPANPSAEEIGDKLIQFIIYP